MLMTQEQRIKDLEGDLRDCITSNDQAWGICDAVAAALGDDLDKEAGSAISVLRLKEKNAELQRQFDEQNEQISQILIRTSEIFHNQHTLLDDLLRDLRKTNSFRANILEEAAKMIEHLGDYCGGHGEPKAPSPYKCAELIRSKK